MTTTPTTDELDDAERAALEGVAPDQLAAGLAGLASLSGLTVAEAGQALTDEAAAILDDDETPLPVPAARALPVSFTAEDLDVLRDTLAKEANLSDAEFALFVKVAARSGLDPFERQIHAVKRKSRNGDRMTIQTGIDGYRLIAERTGMMRGQMGPEWCGPDGRWVDVWLDDDNPPHAARVGVIRAGWQVQPWSVAKWAEYAARNKDGELMGLWPNMPSHMIAKCAEALALRRAFPNELSGIYTDEELEQADVIDVGYTAHRPTPPPPPEPALPEQRVELQARIERLPVGPRGELAEWWRAKVTVPVGDLNRRQVPLAKAKIEQVERLTLDGQWGPEAAAELQAAVDAEQARLEANLADPHIVDPAHTAEAPEPAESVEGGADEQPPRGETLFADDDEGRPFD